jgi:hypothetical protein
VTVFSKLIVGSLIGAASLGAARAQDVSTVGKVSVGTLAITAGVILLHEDRKEPSASSTDAMDRDNTLDIGRGGASNSNSGGGASSGSGPLAPDGAAGLGTAESGSFEGDGSVFTLANAVSAIVTVLTCATSTSATGTISISSTGSSH